MRTRKVKPIKFNTSFLNNNINKVLKKYDTSKKVIGTIKSIFFRLKSEDFEILKEMCLLKGKKVLLCDSYMLIDKKYKIQKR